MIPTSKIPLFAAALMVCGHVIAGGRPPTIPLAPVILKVMVDAKENALIISGRHFGDTAPTVYLAEHVLEIKHSSENKIFAKLPPGIESATYSLTVTSNGHKRATSTIFNAALLDNRHDRVSHSVDRR